MKPIAFVFGLVSACLVCKSSITAQTSPERLTPKSLEQLVDKADIIFYGRVLNTHAGQFHHLPSVVTTLDPLIVLKGPVTKRKRFPLTQLNGSDTGAVAFNEGANVLLFIHSGNGKLFDDVLGPLEEGYFAEYEKNSPIGFTNGMHNQGLWSDKERLWGYKFPKYLGNDYLVGKWPRFGDQEKILEVGLKPCCPRWLSLDFLLAATYAGIHKDQAPKSIQ